MDKLTFILESLDPKDCRPLVFADCDVQFFGDLHEDILRELGDGDIQFQDDVSGCCTGFFICQQNSRVRRLFERTLQELEMAVDPQSNDQTIVNGLLASQAITELRYGMLPREKYFTVAAAIGATVWNGQRFDVPEELLVHHANWTVGVANKIALLKLVREQMESRVEPKR